MTTPDSTDVPLALEDGLNSGAHKVMIKTQDSTHVTLALDDGLASGAHKMMLADANAGKTVTFSEHKNLEVLEKMELSHEWNQGTTMELPHFLRADKIEKTAKTNALMEKPFVTEIKDNGKCGIIQCSTGCYYNVCVPLVRDWVSMIGDPATRMDGLEIQVKMVCGNKDKRGDIESYKVNLIVDRESIVVHLHNTTHLVNVQGKTAKKFCEKTFIPFFQRRAHDEAGKINSLNCQITDGKRGEKRPPTSAAKSRPNS